MACVGVSDMRVGYMACVGVSDVRVGTWPVWVFQASEWGHPWSTRPVWTLKWTFHPAPSPLALCCCRH